MIKSSGRRVCSHICSRYCRRRAKLYEGITPAQHLRDLGKALLVTVLFAVFFYRSVWALPPMTLVGWLYLRRCGHHRRRCRNRRLLVQFKECIQSVAASMRAGYAVENAFVESMADVRNMFGEDCDMEQELKQLRQGLSNNLTLETLLTDMGRRCGLEEMREFAEVFGIARRNGGSIPAMVDAASGSISRKLAVEEDMETLLSARKLEQRVMNVMPFLIVWYVEAGNPGYFDMLYGNPAGVALMTVCLGIYLAAYALSELIFDKTFGDTEQ